MGLKQVVTGCAPDEVAEPLKDLDGAFGRLLGEEANAQEPGLGLDEDALVSAEASSKLRVQSIYQDSLALHEDASSKLPWSLSFMIVRRRTAERRMDLSRGSYETGTTKLPALVRKVRERERASRLV